MYARIRQPSSSSRFVRCFSPVLVPMFLLRALFRYLWFLGGREETSFLRFTVIHPYKNFSWDQGFGPLFDTFGPKPLSSNFPPLWVCPQIYEPFSKQFVPIGNPFGKIRGNFPQKFSVIPTQFPFNVTLGPLTLLRYKPKSLLKFGFFQ